MSIFDDAEDKLIIKLARDEQSLLKALDKGLVATVFEKEENRNLFTVLKRFYLKYHKLPLPDELMLAVQTDGKATKEQKEKSTLQFQVILAAEIPEQDTDVLVDAVISVYKGKKAREVALRLSKDDADRNIDATMDEMVNDLTKLRNMGSTGEMVVNYKEDASERINRYNAVKARQQDTGLYYCFPTLNRITGGQDSKTLWVVRGGPKAGKSTALINMANHVVRTGKNIIYFSAEVNKDVIERRLDAINIGVPMNDIKRGTLNPDEEKLYIDWLTKNDPTRGNFIIIDKGNMTTDSIRATVRDIKTEMPIHLIVVDYLGLIHLPYKTESKWIEVGEVSKELRAIAKEEDVPVLTAQQTNKQGDTANAQEIDRTCDLLLDISRDNPDEDTMAGAVVQVTAKIVYSRDSGLGEFPLEAQFAYSQLQEIQTSFGTPDEI